MRYKKIAVFILAFLTSAVTFAQGATDDFSGKWKTAEGNSVVIAKSGAGFTGLAVEKKIAILKDVHFSDGKWIGVVYNPKKDITADCELILEGNNLKIVATKGLFSKTIYWTKEL
jgi:uncharacterized protein (DUF2147 family)